MAKDADYDKVRFGQARVTLGGWEATVSMPIGYVHSPKAGTAWAYVRAAGFDSGSHTEDQTRLGFRQHFLRAGPPNRKLMRQMRKQDAQDGLTPEADEALTEAMQIVADAYAEDPEPP